jgi:hypothetical protein
VVLTFGIYGAVWLREQARFFNAKLPSHPISKRFTSTALVLIVADVALFAVGLALPPGAVGLFDRTLFGLAFGVQTLGALRIRRRTLYLAAVPGAPPPRVGLLGTVILDVAFLQAKVNRYREPLAAPHFSVRSRPFRDSGRLAWMYSLGPPSLLASLVLILTLAPLGADGVATAMFHRARERAVRRLGPLPLEGFSSAENGLHPILAAGEAIEISESEEARLKTLVRKAVPGQIPQADARFLEGLLARNRQSLLRCTRALAPPRRGLGLSYPTRDDWALPPSLSRQLVLARLLFAQGALALSRTGPASAEPSLRLLGELGRVYENEPPLAPLLVGAAIERLQLRLLSATLDACPDAASARAMASTLLTRPVRDRLMDALRYEAALLLQTERDQRKEIARKAPEDTPLMHAVGAWTGLALLRYSLAGALDQLERYADLFDARFSEMRSGLELKPDEMSFLEKLRLFAAMAAWEAPVKLRALSDSRRGAELALRDAVDPGGVSCAAVRNDLGALEALYQVPDAPQGGCVLRYRLGADFERSSQGKIPAPPFSWRLACPAGGRRSTR